MYTPYVLSCVFYPVVVLRATLRGLPVLYIMDDAGVGYSLYVHLCCEVTLTGDDSDQVHQCLSGLGSFLLWVHSLCVEPGLGVVLSRLDVGYVPLRLCVIPIRSGASLCSRPDILLYVAAGLRSRVGPLCLKSLCVARGCPMMLKRAWFE